MDELLRRRLVAALPGTVPRSRLAAVLGVDDGTADDYARLVGACDDLTLGELGAVVWLSGPHRREQALWQEAACCSTNWTIHRPGSRGHGHVRTDARTAAGGVRVVA